MSHLITVCGLGRCGSSATMAMLHAAGVPIHCPEHRIGNSFESDDVLDLPDDFSWLNELNAGTAFKLLDPHRHQLPDCFNYRHIWLTRNPKEQSRSQRDFLKQIGVSYDVPTSVLATRLKADEKLSLRSLAKSGGPILKVSFEQLIADPQKIATRICHHISLDISNINSMAAVIRNRSARCSTRRR